LSFRDGQLLEKRHFLFNRKQWEIDSDGRDGLILRYYQQPGIETPPPEVLIPDNAGFSASLIEESLELTCGHPVKIVVPQRGTRERIIAMAADNARLYGSMHLPPDDDAVLESLAKVLCLPRALCTIEAFDISNLGSSHAVAGMVRFVNGLPDKVNYRRFTIRDVEGQNDFAMLAEAVTRRLTRLREEQRPFPDLLLIDGGAGQLSAVQGILSDFDNPPMIISLAKQEELLFSPWTDAPVKLPGTDPGLRLMQRIRDEVHRYALTSHKKARGKQFKHSLIENIEGVGPRRAEMLLKQFGSITGIAKASIEDISRIKGITEECAKRIIEAARVYVLKK
jgi:excinuclease ABC subunit C